MFKSGPWVFIFSGVSALGGLACILEWFGIKPRDLQMIPTAPHSVWFIAGLVLFGVSISLSLYSAFLRGRDTAVGPKVNELQTALEKELIQIRQEVRKTQEQIPSIAVNGVPMVGPAAFAAEKARKAAAESDEQRRGQLAKEAVQVSKDLLAFIQRMGTPPPPKYTREELDRMSATRTKELIESEDGDFSEASEFHYGKDAFQLTTRQGLYNNIVARHKRLEPWYLKVAASYALEFDPWVRELNYRFIIEGIIEPAFQLSIQGVDGTKNIEILASRLRELAFQLEVKGSTN